MADSNNHQLAGHQQGITTGTVADPGSQSVAAGNDGQPNPAGRMFIQPLNDMGNAKLFAQKMVDKAIFVEGRGTWLTFNDGHWKESSSQLLKLARKAIGVRHVEARSNRNLFSVLAPEQ